MAQFPDKVPTTVLLWHSLPARFKRQCYYGTVSQQGLNDGVIMAQFPDCFFFNASVTLTQNLDRVSTTVSLWHSFPIGFQDSKMWHRILTGFQRQCHYGTVSQWGFKTVKYDTDSRQGFNVSVIIAQFPNVISRR